MKKLLIATTAVAMATIANAAVINWELNSVWESNDSGKTANGYVTYFISSGDYSIDKALADLQAGKTDFVTTYAMEGIDGKGMLTDGGYVYASEVGPFGTSIDATGYLVIFDAGTIADAKNAYLSQEATTHIESTGAADDMTFGDLTGSKASENWYAVPEPTSGLLLLLGVAGLALRRRRA